MKKRITARAGTSFQPWKSRSSGSERSLKGPTSRRRADRFVQDGAAVRQACHFSADGHRGATRAEGIQHEESGALRRTRLHNARPGAALRRGRRSGARLRLLPLREPRVSDARLLGRHPPPHRPLLGRRRLRQSPGTRRGLPLRPRRGSRLHVRAAREALETARLHRHRRPLRRDGVLPHAAGRRPDAHGEGGGPQVAPHDPRGKGGGGGARDHWPVRPGPPPVGDQLPELMRPVWEGVALAADRYNDPGTFTAFIGYEWTSLVEGNNLHRVVIYRDAAAKALQALPYTNADSSDPEDFWSALARYEEASGGRVLAIPHNGNLSNGLMFAESDPGRTSHRPDVRGVPASAGSPSSRSPRSRATGRPIPCSRRTTSSPISRRGTLRQPGSERRQDRRRCCATSTAALH